MKICIDGIGLSHLQGTGLYTYTYELLNNLFEIYPQPQYEILSGKASCIENRSKNIKLTFNDLKINRKQNNYQPIEEFITEKKINIFHSPNNGFSMPSVKKDTDKCSCAITVHDVIAAGNSKLVDIKYLNKFQQVFPNAIQRADKIIAVSGFIKKELVKLYNIPEEKIEVIYPGCGQQFKHVDDNICSEFLKNTYGIEGKIILHSGSIHIRKRIEKLLHIFKDICKYDKDVKLVIAGKKDGKREEYFRKLNQTVNDLGLSDRVYFTGNVDYMHMQYFYNYAGCVVNLSVYEGFPMSSIEALCCGTPVILSNAEAFKETVKGDGIIVHTNEDAEIRDVILDVLNDKNYKYKSIENSGRIIQKYNWQDAAKKYVRLYEALLPY